MVLLLLVVVMVVGSCRRCRRHARLLLLLCVEWEGESAVLASDCQSSLSLLSVKWWDVLH
jgi:hypothetical protein